VGGDGGARCGGEVALQILAVVIDTGIKAEGIDHVGAFFRPASDADNTRADFFGNLPGDAAHHAGGG